MSSATVLIDEQNQILYLTGSASLYLEPPGGEQTRDLLRLARRGLRGVLRRLVGLAREEGRATPTIRAWVLRDAGHQPVRVAVHPIHSPLVLRPLFLVVFETPGGQPAGSHPRDASPAAAGREAAGAEDRWDLSRNREYARLAAVLRDSSDAVVVTGPDDRIMAWNRGAERLYGYTEAEALGLAVAVLTPEPRRSAELALLRRVRQGEPPDSWETQRVARDGRILDVSVTVTRLRGEAGRADEVVTVDRDVTRLKQLERDVLGCVTEEQVRIGRELHDTVGQELTGLRLMAEILAADLRDPRSPDQALGARVCDGLRGVLERVRSIAHGLVPPEVAADEVGSALAALAARTRESAGVDCSFHQSGVAVLPDAGVATHLVRIAQEAVCNALKHARPHRVAITLTASGAAVELRVADDGSGVSGPTPRGDGLGMRLMRYRAGLINAAFRLDSGPQGTQVTCTLRQEMPHDQAPSAPG
ncbi:PAS domain S-box protein [bacterium]|nr:PAS domain S-box protein [bacterium]